MPLQAVLKKVKSLWPPRRPATLVELAPVGAVLPEPCANCGDTAGHSLKEAGFGGTLLVPYCQRCFASAEGAATRRFAAGLSSLVLALTLLLTLPRLWTSASLFTYLCLVVLGALLPPAVAWLVRPRASQEQTASGRAVWWARRGAVACTSAAWAAALATLNESTEAQGTTRKVSTREPVFTLRVLTGALLGLAVAPALFAFQHPEIVVLNLSEHPFELVVDGSRTARVHVTSLESPRAGVRLRLGAGSHSVVLLDGDGHALLNESMVLSAGRTHLYAPLSAGYCFWLERDVYGRAEAGGRLQALAGDVWFWTLPRPIDTWFASNPEPPLDTRSSGGSLTALRHARCEEAPNDVR